MRGLLLLALVLGIACAPTVRRVRSEGDSSTLVAADFRPYSHMNLYDVVRRLRPYWVEGPRRAQQVFLDGLRLDLGSLRSVHPTSVASVVRLSESESYGRYGSRSNGPSLVVTTRR